VYEESWAEQVKVESGTCPIIDGEYLNVGDRGIREKDKAKCDSCGRSTRSLAGLLMLGYDYNVAEDEIRLDPAIDDPTTYVYRSINLRLVGNELHVEALLPDQSVERFELSTRHKCRNSTMLLSTSWDGTDIMGSVPFVSFISHTSLALGRAEDGSLLVRTGSTEGLFLLEWPLILTMGGTWTRFPPAEPASGQQSAQLSALTP
jgi:hypothetical protein